MPQHDRDGDDYHQQKYYQYEHLTSLSSNVAPLRKKEAIARFFLFIRAGHLVAV
jgi:hypothetical protein